MANLSARQTRLLEILNRLQNINSTSSNSGVSIDFPSVDLGVDLGGISFGGGSGNGDGNGDGPSNIRELLLTLLNENVDVNTPFGTVSGVLIAVQNDYIVLVDNGDQVLVRMENIETVNPT